MKDSIKNQSLPDLIGINARLKKSLSLYIFRRVKNPSGPQQTFWALSDVLASMYHLIILSTYERLTRTFFSDSSLAVAAMLII